MTEKNEDRRVRRTKRLLIESLMRLMKDKKVKDISVRELTDMADMNRGTFYIHYRDVFDMIDQVEQELFKAFDKIMLDHAGDNILEHPLPVLRDLFEFLNEHANVCMALLGENGDITFVNKLKAVVRDKCLNEWMQKRDGGDNKIIQYFDAFVVSGCVGLFRIWLETGRKESPDEVAALAEKMIRQGAQML